jgi:hypothetical protein
LLTITGDKNFETKEKQMNCTPSNLTTVKTTKKLFRLLTILGTSLAHFTNFEKKNKQTKAYASSMFNYRLSNISHHGFVIIVIS